mmetsp:Transcript_20048/g.43619  ORF Transcript_20048/g.43619 Transcript_20048/m.43619 type:complete len:230 (-) Transcript_20048:18-707(-)
MRLNEHGNFFQSTESAHGFKRSQGDGHLWFVIGITIVRWIFRVESLCIVFVWMGLNTKRLSRTKNFEQKGELFSNGILEQFSGLQSRLSLRMGADPEFCVRRIGINLAQCLVFEGISSHTRIHSTDSPRIVFHHGDQTDHRFASVGRVAVFDDAVLDGFFFCRSIHVNAINAALFCSIFKAFICCVKTNSSVAAVVDLRKGVVSYGCNYNVFKRSSAIAWRFCESVAIL